MCHLGALLIDENYIFQDTVYTILLINYFKECSKYYLKSGRYVGTPFSRSIKNQRQIFVNILETSPRLWE